MTRPDIAQGRRRSQGSPQLALAWVAVAGSALTLAFPEPDLAPLAWVCIAPLLHALRGAGARRGLLLGTVFGLFYFGTLLHWVSVVGYLAWFLLVLLQAAYVGVFGALWGAASRSFGPVARIVVPGLLWVAVVEYARALAPVVGFTWGQLAQSQHNVPVVLETAAWAGSWAVAFVVVTVNALLAAAGAHGASRDVRGAALRLLAAGAILLVALPIPSPAREGAPVDVAIVQGNIPETQPASYEKDLVILDNHVRLTREVGESADLVLWAESSVGIDPARNPEVGDALTAAAGELERPLVVGGNLARDDDRYQVMAYLVEPGEGIVDAYQKTHLVPFGEYVPARGLLDWIPALGQVPLDAVAGDEPGLFEVAGGGVAPVISFEADFGSLVKGRMTGAGRLLVVLTNTSTWRHTWASAQHVAMSQVRAAETGAYVAHAALTGVSAFVDPSGRVIERSALWRPALLEERVRFSDGVTFYARTGDWLAWLSLSSIVVCVLTVRVRRER